MTGISMNHTYTLTAEGFVNPIAARRQGRQRAEVRHPRRIELDGMSLRLVDDEPDLPVGAQVEVWVNRWFHCETLECIEYKQRLAAEISAAKKVHENALKDSAVCQYGHPTAALIESKAPSEELAAHLAFLVTERDQAYGVYRAYWRAYAAEDKQKSDDAYTTMSVLNECIMAVSTHVRSRLKDKGLLGCTAYAYSPREGGRDGFYSAGRDHFKVLTPVSQGRFRRDSGDALCKTAENFWMLESLKEDRPVSCKTCLDRMIKLLKR